MMKGRTGELSEFMHEGREECRKITYLLSYPEHGRSKWSRGSDPTPPLELLRPPCTNRNSNKLFF